MRNARHISHTLVVGLVVACLLAATTYLMQHREADPSALTAQTIAKKPAAKPLRLKVNTNRVTAGTVVTFTVTTSTRHPRKVRLQRWNKSTRTWRNVANRTARRSVAVRVKATSGAWSYRAFTPAQSGRTGGKTHTRPAARSGRVTVTAYKPAPAKVIPANLTADEKTLLAAVRSARTSYSGGKGTGDTTVADLCLTQYARSHSEWMATKNAAIDPGTGAHRTAKRALPSTRCPGWKVNAVTRAIGATSSTAAAVSLTIDSLLSSPLGDTDRLLSTCETSPQFTFGVALEKKAGVDWITVLIASPTSRTTASGVC